MAKKFYVVWAGREPGIFTDWASCKRSVDRFAGARYKSFPTRQEAEAAYASGSSGATSTRAKGKNASTAQTTDDTEAVVPEEQFNVVIYCDGGCDPNPGKAGSGSAVYRDGKLAELWYGLYDPHGTNNTAELNALHQSLLIAKKAINDEKTVAIYCDSMYSINCISVWAYGWKKNGWKKRGGEIKNLALIQEIHALYESIKDDLQLNHVKAHVGVEGNELADRMTMIAVDRAQKDFAQFTDKIDIKALLNLRAG